MYWGTPMFGNVSVLEGLHVTERLRESHDRIGNLSPSKDCRMMLDHSAFFRRTGKIRMPLGHALPCPGLVMSTFKLTAIYNRSIAAKLCSGASCSFPLPSGFGTNKTLKARFWSWLEPFPVKKPVEPFQLFPHHSAKGKRALQRRVPSKPCSCSWLRSDFRVEIARKSVTPSNGTPLCPYGIAYRRAYGLSTSGLFKPSLCTPVSITCAGNNLFEPRALGDNF